MAVALREISVDVGPLRAGGEVLAQFVRVEQTTQEFLKRLSP